MDFHLTQLSLKILEQADNDSETGYEACNYHPYYGGKTLTANRGAVTVIADKVVMVTCENAVTVTCEIVVTVAVDRAVTIERAMTDERALTVDRY